MSNTEYIKMHVNALKKLLDDPHPGLSTWCKLYGEHMQAISEFWTTGPEGDSSDSEVRS